MRIDYYQGKFVANFHQDFVANRHSDFFQGQTDRGLFCWPNHSGETWLSKQGEDEDNGKCYFITKCCPLPQMPSTMDKLYLAGRALDRVFNFRSGCMHTMHLLPSAAIQPNLELKTRPEQLLGFLPLVISLYASTCNIFPSNCEPLMSEYLKSLWEILKY